MEDVAVADPAWALVQRAFAEPLAAAPRITALVADSEAGLATIPDLDALVVEWLGLAWGDWQAACAERGASRG